jgi:stringent starvation protein B
MKLTPILIASPHPDRQLPHRIAQFPDFLAFNMSPRAIGDLVIGPDGLRFVTRLAGGDTIERVVLPLGSWHSVRVRETQHQFSLAFPEALGGLRMNNPTGEPLNPRRGPDAPQERSKTVGEAPLWWPEGLALMAGGAGSGSGHTGGSLGTSPTEQPAPAWEGLISATQADHMRTAQDIDGRAQRQRGHALSTAQQRWGGAGLVMANQEIDPNAVASDDETSAPV